MSTAVADAANVSPPSPYRGLRPYTEADAAFFFGREAEGENVAANLAHRTGQIRANTNLPIAVGFGISNPEQARMVASCADAVVVGSAVVNEIAQHGKSPQLVSQVSRFVNSLSEGVKSRDTQKAPG